MIMNKLFLSLLILIGLQTQAQTLCDLNMTYTTGTQMEFEVAIPVTGNGLPNMAPLYVITTVGQYTYEDSCFSGPCTHTVYNMYEEEAITSCITYTLTDSLGYVDTLTCCFNQVWNGQAWVFDSEDNTTTWACSQNSIGCFEVMDGSGDFASEEECNASCDSIIECTGSVEITEENGQLTANVYGVTLPVSYEWSNLENTQTITPSADGVYSCYIVDADGCDYSDVFPYYTFDFCDSTWYDADFTEADGLWEVTLSGYISEDLNDQSDTVLHSFTITPSNDFMSQYGSAGSYPHSWTPEFALSLSIEDTLTVCWSAAVYADGLNAFPQGYSEMCNMNNEQMLCDEWVWDGEAWARSTSGTASIGDLNLKDAKLLKVIDALGRIVDEKSTNKLLFYIYDNGLIEKKFIVE
jgi:hypothetical protein